jgi:hypothetical protein
MEERRLLHFFKFSLALVFFAFAIEAQAQQVEEDTTRNGNALPVEVVPENFQRDSVLLQDTARVTTPKGDTDSLIAAAPLAKQRAKFISSIGIGTDYLKLAAPLLNFGQRYEIQADIIFKEKILVLFEAGQYELEPETAIRNGTYRLNGQYARAGLAYIIFKDQVNRIYLGGTYGMSQFEDQGTFIVNSRLWNEFRDSFARKNMEANWLEFMVGTEGKAWKNLMVGWKFRLRFLQETILSQEEGNLNAGTVEVYNIPGYGKPASNIMPAINLYLKLNLNF